MTPLLSPIQSRVCWVHTGHCKVVRWISEWFSLRCLHQSASALITAGNCTILSPTWPLTFLPSFSRVRSVFVDWGWIQKSHNARARPYTSLNGKVLPKLGLIMMCHRSSGCWHLCRISPGSFECFFLLSLKFAVFFSLFPHTDDSDVCSIPSPLPRR